MKERDIEKKFGMLQQEITLNGDILEAAKREQRAALDALRLEVETLRRCLRRFHPDSEACFEELRAETTQTVDPEAL